jgi:hypothetical protein
MWFNHEVVRLKGPLQNILCITQRVIILSWLHPPHKFILTRHKEYKYKWGYTSLLSHPTLHLTYGPLRSYTCPSNLLSCMSFKPRSYIDVKATSSTTSFKTWSQSYKSYQQVPRTKSKVMDKELIICVAFYTFLDLIFNLTHPKKCQCSWFLLHRNTPQCLSIFITTQYILYTLTSYHHISSFPTFEVHPINNFVTNTVDEFPTEIGPEIVYK